MVDKRKGKAIKSDHRAQTHWERQREEEQEKRGKEITVRTHKNKGCGS